MKVTQDPCPPDPTVKNQAIGRTYPEAHCRSAQSDHSIRGRSLGPVSINATTSSALAMRPPQASTPTLICLPDCSRLSWTCPWTNHSPVSTGRSAAYRRTSVEFPL